MLRLAGRHRSPVTRVVGATLTCTLFTQKYSRRETGWSATNDSIESRPPGINPGPLDLIRILIEEWESGEPGRGRVGLDSLQDRVVILARSCSAYRSTHTPLRAGADVVFGAPTGKRDTQDSCVDCPEQIWPPGQRISPDDYKPAAVA